MERLKSESDERLRLVNLIHNQKVLATMSQYENYVRFHATKFETLGVVAKTVI